MSSPRAFPDALTATLSYFGDRTAGDPYGERYELNVDVPKGHTYVASSDSLYRRVKDGLRSLKDVAAATRLIARNAGGHPMDRRLDGR